MLPRRLSAILGGARRFAAPGAEGTILGRTVAILCAFLLLACEADRPAETLLTVSGSSVGAEGALLRAQLARFEAHNPGVRVELRQTPDTADQRHQLYVQWLNARTPTPDVLQLDVAWAAELAAAGWLLPLDRFRPDTTAFFPRAIEASRWNGTLYALPWFVDMGMLYWRTDLVARAPVTFEELTREAEEARRRHRLPYGFAWSAARYEGLVTTFLEHLGGFGGSILDARGRVVVDSPAAVRALSFMRESIGRTVPPQALGWQEEHVRFAFQSGQAVFMRNWPYATAALADPARSRVAGRFAVAPMPSAPGGSPTAALGGGQLAINARTRYPEAAYALIAFLTAPEQMLERARVGGLLPARAAVYDDPALRRALPVDPAALRRVLEGAVPRPVVPSYAELSEVLQIHLHRALSGQEAPAAALAAAAVEIREVLARAEAQPAPAGRAWLVGLAALAAVLLGWRLWRRRSAPAESDPSAWWFVLPTLLVMAAFALLPLGFTVWESLHHHDLRMPWRGSPFAGLDNYAEVLGDARFWEALGHTGFFALASVLLELTLGLALALLLHRAVRGRGIFRTIVLLPWAVPTVVAALVWRFFFEGGGALLHPTAAWGPILLADVWKMTPFVALLLLAGLQGIDPALYEAARLDGAGPWRQFVHVTLPLLRPAIVVAVLFRLLDALRVFDLVYVLTGGGPGTATEPIALYTFTSLLQNLRFGYGSALSVLTFLLAFGIALLFARGLGADLFGGRR